MVAWSGTRDGCSTGVWGDLLVAGNTGESTTSSCVRLAGAKPFRQSLRLPHGNVWWFIGGVGLFDVVGYVCSAAGLAAGPLTIVGVLISLFSAVTVLLAWVFLRERLEWSQWLGVILIFAGIVLVNS